MSKKIGIVGLGYVGLPLALAFADKHAEVIGYDYSSERISALKNGVDVTSEGFEDRIASTSLVFTDDVNDLASCDIYVVAVPTPIDDYKRPDLRALHAACKAFGPGLNKGDIVVFESTVYPGVTEEVCGPDLEAASGLKCGEDFFLAYSPERVNPGDKEHTLETVVKVVAGQNQAVLDTVAELYETVVEVGVYKATSIKVAEAAKVIENTQRDLNISLMNELAIIFDRMGLCTREVLDAACTKWNFLPFKPGLVGGHCIGVDPYYLTTKAQQLGYQPQVILAGRRINDNMGKFVASKLVKQLSQNGIALQSAKIAILGITFKENVSDIRNSRVPDIVYELSDYGASVQVYDPRADAEETKEEYNILISNKFDVEPESLDAIVLAVAHQEYVALETDYLCSRFRTGGGILFDIKSIVKKDSLASDVFYWSL